MSLWNRISIVVGVHNLGHEVFWTKVLNAINHEMPGSMKTCIVKQDENKERKRKYIAMRETKLKRVKHQIENVKMLMKKQKIDAVRGFTYGSGIALQNKYPAEVVRQETMKKSKYKVSCPWFACNKGYHKTSKSKVCAYHYCASIEETEVAVDKKMRLTYPEEYGKYYLLSSYDFAENTFSQIFQLLERNYYCCCRTGNIAFYYFLRKNGSSNKNEK